MDGETLATLGHATDRSSAVVIAREDRGPSDRPWTFARLLGDVSVETFCRDYWGRQPLLVRGGAGNDFASLTGFAEIESLMAIPRVLEDRMISVRAKGERASLAPATIGDAYRRLREGASLQFRKMERFLSPQAPLSVLYRDMQLALQHPGVSISCFVAPPDTEQLGPHYDGTEIFTLQVSGRKRWRLYGRLAAEGRASVDGATIGQPHEEFILGPGDLFYMPRGHIHEVTSEDDGVSLSLPIIIEPVTWKEMLPRMMEQLAAHPAFREALPAGLLLRPDATALLAEGIAARIPMIAAAASAIDATEMIETAATVFLTGLGAPPDPHVAEMLSRATLEPCSRLVPRHGRAWRVAVRDGRAVLTLGGGDAMTGPESIVPALRAIMARDEPVAAALLHPSLSEKSCLTLARKLVDIGALAVV